MGTVLPYNTWDLMSDTYPDGKRRSMTVSDILLLPLFWLLNIYEKNSGTTMQNGHLMFAFFGVRRQLTTTALQHPGVQRSQHLRSKLKCHNQKRWYYPILALLSTKPPSSTIIPSWYLNLPIGAYMVTPKNGRVCLGDEKYLGADTWSP